MKIPFQFGISGNKWEEYIPDQTHSDRVKKLLALKESKLIIDICNHYIKNFIPSPIENESIYWMCSCFPGNKSNIPVRINIWWHEVFNISKTDNNNLNPVWYLTIFTDSRKLNCKLIDDLENNISELEFDNTFRYNKGLDTQLAAILPLKSYFKFIENEDVYQSIQLYNYDLSCKGKKAHKGHNFEFVRHLMNENLSFHIL